MPYKCNKCKDTGYSDGSAYLDCGACNTANERAKFNKWRECELGSVGTEDDDWAIHQRALAMAPKQEAPAQEPVAHLKFWAAQSWSGNGNHDVDCGEGLEVCEAGEIGADKLPAFPVYRAPAAANGALTDEHAPVAQDCGACLGSGWVSRDADIGTEQECFACDGSGKSDDAIPAITTGALTEEQVVCALGCIANGRNAGYISTENAKIVREFIRAALSGAKGN